MTTSVAGHASVGRVSEHRATACAQRGRAPALGRRHRPGTWRGCPFAVCDGVSSTTDAHAASPRAGARAPLAPFLDQLLATGVAHPRRLPRRRDPPARWRPVQAATNKAVIATVADRADLEPAVVQRSPAPSSPARDRRRRQRRRQAGSIGSPTAPPAPSNPAATICMPRTGSLAAVSIRGRDQATMAHSITRVARDRCTDDLTPHTREVSPRSLTAG